MIKCLVWWNISFYSSPNPLPSVKISPCKSYSGNSMPLSLIRQDWFGAVNWRINWSRKRHWNSILVGYEFHSFLKCRLTSFICRNEFSCCIPLFKFALWFPPSLFWLIPQFKPQFMKLNWRHSVYFWICRNEFAGIKSNKLKAEMESNEMNECWMHNEAWMKCNPQAKND